MGLSAFQDFCCYLVKQGPSLLYQSAEPHILLLISDAYLAFVDNPVKSHSVLFSFPYDVGGGALMFSEQLKRKMEAEPWSPRGSEEEASSLAAAVVRMGSPCACSLMQFTASCILQDCVCQ